MAYQSWRVWDGTSALAGIPQATPEALTKAYCLDNTKKLIIYKDANGNEGNVAVYASTVSTETIQADFDAEVARQQAEEERAKQPTQTDILGQQIAALSLSDAEKTTVISQLGSQLVQAQLGLAALKGGATS